MEWRRVAYHPKCLELESFKEFTTAHPKTTPLRLIPRLECTSGQSARDAFERWEAVYRPSIGALPAETYMDIENARCQTETDYYSKPPLPFISRVRVKEGNQN